MKSLPFEKQTNIASIAKFLKKSGARHPSYCHYTTLSRFKQMMSSKTIWPTRCDSPDFDDTIEQQKYGCPDVQKHLYFSCFSHAIQESAAMWGLYCPPTYQALRISISRHDMELLAKANCFAIRAGKVSKAQCKIKSRGVGDVGYASVSDGDDRDRSNTLFWDGHYTQRLERLKDKKNAKHLTGFAKDAEWCFERETRLWVKLREISKSSHIAIRIPDAVVQNMRFTISPWINDDEKSFVKECIRKWIDVAVPGAGDKAEISDSVLAGGLKKWAGKHGL